ncbi:MAG: hypothetical protein ACFFDI_15290 [Promethearchaeota archaeon]
MEFYSNDKRVYIDPIKEIDSYRRRADLEYWPAKLIYQPIPWLKADECFSSVLVKNLLLYIPQQNSIYLREKCSIVRGFSTVRSVPQMSKFVCSMSRYFVL